ncbi:MAG TPA: acyl-CoA dehydrogenase family protein [Dehalococcoidales bacterium]|nr:acyl-CoA dehydrogenase family protein [Dehalococcoidales bacterium]
MDFSFTGEQDKLRREVRDFFNNELPSDFRPATDNRGVYDEKQMQFMTELQKKAGKKGYLAPGWGTEIGGLCLSDIEQGIVLEETGFRGIRWPAETALRVCGPALLVFGTEEQKQMYLPAIAAGEVVWYEAITEKDAGSDKANINLKASADGDNFILNGQKVFISAPAPADFLFTLARTSDTEPKQDGLTLFLLDAHAPGISYAAAPTLGDFTVKIFFENVKVPKSAVLGQLNRGFYHMAVAAEFERTGTDIPAAQKRELEELVQFAKDEKHNGTQLIDNPEFRDMLAERAIAAELATLSAWRDVWFFNQRKRLGAPPPSTGELQRKTGAARSAKQIIDAFGLYGQLAESDSHAKFGGKAQQEWLASRSMHAGGTIEVNKGNLAEKGLGLPVIPPKFNKDIAKSLKEKE